MARPLAVQTYAEAAALLTAAIAAAIEAMRALTEAIAGATEAVALLTAAIAAATEAMRMLTEALRLQPHWYGATAASCHRWQRLCTCIGGLDCPAMDWSRAIGGSP